MDVAALQQALRDLDLEPATTSVPVLEGMLRNELRKHAHQRPTTAHEATVLPTPAMATRPAPRSTLSQCTGSTANLQRQTSSDSVISLHGVGAKTAAALSQMGVESVRELAECDPGLFEAVSSPAVSATALTKVNSQQLLFI